MATKSPSAFGYVLISISGRFCLFARHASWLCPGIVSFQVPTRPYLGAKHCTRRTGHHFIILELRPTKAFSSCQLVARGRPTKAFSSFQLVARGRPLSAGPCDGSAHPESVASWVGDLFRADVQRLHRLVCRLEGEALLR